MFQQFGFFCGIWCYFCGTQNHLGLSQFCSNTVLCFFFGSTSFRDNPIDISWRYPFRLNGFSMFFLLSWSAQHGFFRCLCTRCPSMNQQFTTTSATMPLRMLLATRITMNSWICSWLFIFPMGYGICFFFFFFLRVPEANPRNRVVLSHR